MSTIPHGPDTGTARRHGLDDDVLTAFDETWYRWVAWRRALADDGPDEEMFFAVLELQLAADRWRERFLAALARRGIPLDYALGAA